VLAAFDVHLRRARGVCEGTRRNYGRYARAFLEAVSADSAADVAAIRAGDVAGFAGDLASRYRPGTVALAASGLRSFLRFVRAEGTAWGPAGGRGPDGAASPGRPGPASGAGALGAADRVAGFVLAAGAAGPGDHLVHGPAGDAGQRDRAAAAGGPGLAQRHRAGACPQDRSRGAAAPDRRGRGRAGGLPAGRTAGHAVASGVRAAPAAGRRAGQ
jgi:Phage integrase, N-terminal SAM-like domain